MKRERLFAALLFAVAASLFWLGFVAVSSLTAVEFVARGATVSVAAAALVAARLAPRLIADARRSASVWRGAMAGLVVTLLSYVLGAVLLAVGAVVWGIATEGFDQLAVVPLSMIFIIGVGLLYAVTLLSPALAFGAVAGVVFYHVARLDVRTAT